LQVVERVFGQRVRLMSNDGQLAIQYQQYDTADQTIDALLGGQMDIRFNVPDHRRADVVNAGLQTWFVPDPRWYSISMNWADPVTRPDLNPSLPITPVTYAPHPILQNVAVRQALIEATDVASLAALYHAYVSDFSDPSGVVNAVPYNPDSARQRLEANGWKDVNRDGIRECVGCALGEEGRPLALMMLFENEDMLGVARLLAEQWRRVGIDLTVLGVSDGVDGRFDVLLETHTATFYETGSLLERFGWVEGVSRPLYTNVNMYRNPTLEAAIRSAANAPNCTGDWPALRAQVRDALNSDFAHVWLFPEGNFTSASRRINGFTPIYGAPDGDLTQLKGIP
jgi:ABC-type transport system substrate-binding protein